MLTKFRKGADNIFVRILLGFIALSFVGFGASSFLGGNSQGDIISFSKTDSIPMERFLATKAKQIEHVQRENNINLTEEQIKELNIDHQVLQSLVNEAMIAYLGKIYDLEISENIVINFVKKMPYFQDKDRNFDLKVFKAAFRNSKRQEDEYLEELQNTLIKSTLLNVFMESFKPSKIMVNNIVNYMAETKYFDLISIDLTHKITDFKNNQISQKELEDFYKNNEKDFVLPELRTFDYAVIGKDFFAKEIKIDEKEIKSYYEENKNDFENNSYKTVKKDVYEVLSNIKLDELIADFTKIIAEDVANGLDLKRLAEKHGFKILSINKISQTELVNDKKLGLADIAEAVFEMVEDEVSYPVELPDQHKVILTQLKNIAPSRTQKFSEVKNQIYSRLQEKAIIIANIEMLEKIKENYNVNKINIENLKTKGIMIESNKFLSRVDFQVEKKIHPELAYLIFKTEKNHATRLIRVDNKAYFAFIKNNKINEDKVKNVAANSLERIKAAIKESVMQELIGYLTEQNDMKVKL